MKRFTSAIITAAVTAVLLTGCGEDDCDDDARGALDVSVMSLTDGKSGGSSGGGSKGGSKGGSGTTNDSTSTTSGGSHRVDDDWFKSCDS